MTRRDRSAPEIPVGRALDRTPHCRRSPRNGGRNDALRQPDLPRPTYPGWRAGRAGPPRTGRKARRNSIPPAATLRRRAGPRHPVSARTKSHDANNRPTRSPSSASSSTRKAVRARREGAQSLPHRGSLRRRRGARSNPGGWHRVALISSTTISATPGCGSSCRRRLATGARSQWKSATGEARCRRTDPTGGHAGTAHLYLLDKCSAQGGLRRGRPRVEHDAVPRAARRV